MKRSRLNLGLMLLLAGAALAATPALTSSTGTSTATAINSKHPNFNDFRLLLSRNIFSRMRNGDYREPGTRGPDTGRRPPRQEQYLVLTIVVKPDKPGDPLTAFIEDKSNGVTRPYRVGEAVAGGKISEIGFDTVTFDAGGKKTKVEVGLSLAGVAPVLPNFYDSAAAGPTTAPAGVTPPPLPPGAGDMAERMRQRRAAGM